MFYDVHSTLSDQVVEQIRIDESEKKRTRLELSEPNSLISIFRCL